MERLKLLALDADDLKVVSSCCQDSVLKMGSMEYIPSENRFILMLNRFVWENETGSSHERRQSILHFERVNNVQISGLPVNDKEVVLSMLAVLFEEGEAPSGHIELVFAGDGAIKLEVECIEALLTDMPAAWQTGSRPDHEKDT